MNFKNIIRRLRLWFYTRKEIMDEMQRLVDIIEVDTEKYIQKIEALDQNKLYVLCTDEDISMETQKVLLTIFETYRKKIAWTLPQLIIINRPIREMTKEEIEIIAKQIGEKHISACNKP